MKIELQARALELYEKGFTDSAIGKEILVHAETVRRWRIENNLIPNYLNKTGSKINKNQLKELVESGKTDKEIALIMGVKPIGIYNSRIRNGFIRPSFNEAKSIKLTSFQKQVLIGTLLGDSCLIKRKDSYNAQLRCSHGPLQKNYAKHKHNVFESLGSVYYESVRKTPDKRTGKCYASYSIRTKTNPELNSFYNAFYKDGKKVIPFELFEDFTEVSLAYLFMDDGSKINSTINIATMCFDEEELIKFVRFLYNKFDLAFTIQKNKLIYLMSHDFTKFKNLVSPYIHEDLMYKLSQ